MSTLAIYSPKQLANYLKLTRQKHGFTQAELAARIGIKQGTISNFENNPDKTTIKTFFKLIQALELSLVLYDKDEMRNGDPDSRQKEMDW
ncbi:type II toxin-antitoxin system antitoxin HipB [Enterobacter hormaechei]|uniref:type II toxin-antitoxin system antitoxin HipB n=1 Tax=Enterobacter TaxID=547 RepID=UPI0021D28F6D|nr:MULTISPECIES: type II toxin-antitoxin system antitoxin HipB [Enterobacter]HDW3273903.1 type II toxin-antitoxin system antitoxin HipB [Enterobacter asburiae]ELC6456156.1 type II toxin-antitoxin system antitoxin HipB [Enterobacter hormaechei]MCU6154299.1 type II toxin-antitoxin system antitoxin HipB [Enterobacter hormaechei]WKW40293.1 type II toxin-antitoxin system antitoxin HipB [Enterobacter mori]WNN63467.1 type II toxin-antitoxin system antitoxin HipB [Enterobacter hormaechei]